MGEVLQAEFDALVANGLWENVSSTNLKAIAYVRGVGRLWVRFRSSGVYAYDQVPSSIYVGLLGAGSKGKYFHQFVKDQFTFHGPFFV